jgi:hypothetical protein
MTLTIHELAKSLLDFEIDSGEWDSPPMLQILSQRQDAPGPHVTMAPLLGGHPVEVLAQLARRADVDSLVRGQLLGLALFTEGWAVPMESDRQDSIQGYLDGGGRIADHEGRIEIKQVYAWDGSRASGWTFHRGKDAPVEELYPELIKGRAPDALKNLFDYLR